MYVMYESNLLKAMKAEKELNIENMREIEKIRYNVTDSKELTDLLCRIEEKASRHERDIVACINRTITLQKYAIKLISTLERSEDQAVMYERYILGQQWEDVSDKTHWSISQCYNMNRRALEEIETKNPNFKNEIVNGMEIK